MTDEELLEEYGEESAKTEYSRAMRLLEKLRNNALVVLKNGSENTVRNVKVSAKIFKYMDFPSEGDVVAELKKNQTVEIPLLTQINSNALSINEDTSVQIQFAVTCF